MPKASVAVAANTSTLIISAGLRVRSELMASDLE
jgi:hypothetical protein